MTLGRDRGPDELAPVVRLLLASSLPGTLMTGQDIGCSYSSPVIRCQSVASAAKQVTAGMMNWRQIGRPGGLQDTLPLSSVYSPSLGSYCSL